MIRFEKEICKYLNIPGIPQKKWDGKSSFRNGVAIVKLGFEGLCYAVCSYDEEKDNNPRVVKSFSTEPFYGIESIFVVPNYMETDIENADLDEESKKAAKLLIDEANQLTETEDVKENNELDSLPEWIFPEIHSLEEAQAWIKDYNSKRKVKGGKIPSNQETLKLRLMNIYSQMKKQ